MPDESSIRVAICPKCGARLPERSSECSVCHAVIDIEEEQTRPTLTKEELFGIMSSESRDDDNDASPATDPESAEDSAGEASGENVPDANENGETDSTKSARHQQESEQDELPASGVETVERSPSTDTSHVGASRDLPTGFDLDEPGALDPDPLIGVVIGGRYRIIEMIGRGGMGVVYKVEHTEIGKMLALKLLAGEISQQHEVIKRFKREALLTSKLSHPNSVQVFDFGTADGLTFLVMELVVGQDLGKTVARCGPLPAVRVAKIVVQVCSALAEAHALGIVHRDIKPENILLSDVREEFEMVKVLDFGLAKLRESSELNSVTGTGQIIGTPYYMSPEQIHGKEVDSRSDIYSLGAVMYEALTGKPVFAARTPMGVITRHLTEKPKPMSEVLHGSPPPERMERIVLKCLEKDPDDRFQRVEDLQDALIAFLHDLGLSGVDMLLSNEELSRLQTALGRNSRDPDALTPEHQQIATRDEVAAFYRKLARDRIISIVVSVSLFLGIAGGLAWYLTRPPPPVPFRGVETEPNDTAVEANEVPFGQSVKGMLGKRLSKDAADRDFYRVVVPSGVSAISISNDGLPNMATCTWIYKASQSEPLGRFCSGDVGVPLKIRSMRVEPGPYLLLVKQDRLSRLDGGTLMVLENVSDQYTLHVGASTVDDSLWEVERNDSPPTASLVQLGGSVSGHFEWYGDVDTVCVDKTSEVKHVRWVVKDAELKPRDLGAVLSVTPSHGPNEHVPLRVHSRKSSRHAPTEFDVVSPWMSPPFETSTSERLCLSLRLALDPWAGPGAPKIPPVSAEPWTVRLVPVVEMKHGKNDKPKRKKRR